MSKMSVGTDHTYTLDGTKILRETWGSNTLVPIKENSMRFDIVSLNDRYRGIERVITSGDFCTPKAKEHFDELLTYHFEYLDLMCSPCKSLVYNKSTFEQLEKYYFLFKSYGIDCEIIAYDNSPIDNVFDKKFELLGIDVVHELAESLLESPEHMNAAVKRQLNSFGLLNKPEDIDIVLSNCICGDNEWKLCWVYEVIV